MTIIIQLFIIWREFASKQWQRLVFNEQQKLIINELIYGKYSKTYQNFKSISEKELKSVLIYGFNSLETTLKKLKFIKEIVIDSNVVINGEMIELFTKCCDDLNKLSLNGC